MRLLVTVLRMGVEFGRRRPFEDSDEYPLASVLLSSAAGDIPRSTTWPALLPFPSGASPSADEICGCFFLRRTSAENHEPEPEPSRTTQSRSGFLDLRSPNRVLSTENLPDLLIRPPSSSPPKVGPTWGVLKNRKSRRREARGETERGKTTGAGWGDKEEENPALRRSPPLRSLARARRRSRRHEAQIPSPSSQGCFLHFIIAAADGSALRPSVPKPSSKRRRTRRDR